MTDINGIYFFHINADYLDSLDARPRLALGEQQGCYVPTLFERPSACGARERGHGPPKASPRCAGYVALNAVKFWAGAAEPCAKQKNACVRLW